MQIYTDTPQNFAEPLIYSRGDSIFVLTEDGDCNITFYDKVTEEVKSYKGNYAAYANPSDSLVICLNRHNYVPKIVIAGPVINIQNENIGDSRTYVADSVKIGTHVTDLKPLGNVVLEGGTTHIRAKTVKLMPGTLVKRGSQLKINNN